jgi:hypothetical protein
MGGRRLKFSGEEGEMFLKTVIILEFHNITCVSEGLSDVQKGL